VLKKDSARHRRAYMALAAVVSVIASLAACSSSGNSSQPGGTSGTGQASGAPIVFGTISATGPGTEAADVLALPGMEAAVSAINAAGGINGRMLQMDFCDTYGNVNDAAECATKFANDKSIVATVGNDVFGGNQQIDSALQAGGLASIGPDVTFTSDYDDQLVYPLHAGAVASFSGGIALLAAEGYKNIAAACYQVPAVPPAVEFTQDTILPKFPGAKLVGTQFLPPTTTDTSSYAAALIASHPDGIFESAGTLTIPLAISLRQQGYTGPIVMSSAVTSPAQVKQMGNLAGQVLLNSNTAHSGPAWDQYQADLNKYQPSAAAGVGDAALWDWMAVQLFAHVLKELKGAPTRASIVSALNSLSNYSTGGLTPTINFTKPSTVPGYSRLFDPVVYGLTYTDGAFKDIQPLSYINMFTGQNSKS
jgi:branched-chain amino acid transport system substrate-binding protein